MQAFVGNKADGPTDEDLFLLFAQKIWEFMDVWTDQKSIEDQKYGYQWKRKDGGSTYKYNLTRKQIGLILDRLTNDGNTEKKIVAGIPSWRQTDKNPSDQVDDVADGEDDDDEEKVNEEQVDAVGNEELPAGNLAENWFVDGGALGGEAKEDGALGGEAKASEEGKSESPVRKRARKVRPKATKNPLHRTDVIRSLAARGFFVIGDSCLLMYKLLHKRTSQISTLTARSWKRQMLLNVGGLHIETRRRFLLGTCCRVKSCYSSQLLVRLNVRFHSCSEFWDMV